MAARPPHTRTASTNLTGGGSYRILEGKIAIVTGASRGIGAAICENLATKGCSLVMNFTSEASKEKTQKLANQLQQEHGIKAVIVQADMGSLEGPAHVVDIAKNNFSHPKTGKFQLDVIINNAGVSWNKPIEEITQEDFKQYDINVRGPLLLVQAALPHLPNDRSGRIVNVSSISSSLGFIQQSIYGGTKAALEAMTRTWARELAERCTVNAINPGPVDTDMYSGTSEMFQGMISNWTRAAPLTKVRPGIDRQEFIDNNDKAGGRPAYAAEIAGTVGMLVTPESSWCTGSVICANGGIKFSS